MTRAFNSQEADFSYQISFVTDAEHIKKELLESVPTQITLFELCSQINERGEVNSEMIKREAERLPFPEQEDIDPGEFESAEEREIAIIQVQKKAEKMLFTIFTRIGREESVKDLFGIEQHKAMKNEGFDLDEYLFDRDWTPQNVTWKATEIFRYWVASNAKAQRCGLSPDMLQMQLQEYIDAFAKVFYCKFINRKSPTKYPEYDNPFLDDERLPTDESYIPQIEPLILESNKASLIPSMSVRLFINDSCIVIPLPPIFFTHESRVCYLNELGGYPDYANTNRSYQIATMLKVVAVGLLFQKAKIPLSKNEPLDIKSLNKKITKLKDLTIPGLLDNQLANMWDYFKFGVRVRHIYPFHKLDTVKQFNFLENPGLSTHDIEQIDSLELGRIIRNAIPMTTKQKKLIKATKERVNPPKKKRRKRIYNSSIPRANLK